MEVRRLRQVMGFPKKTGRSFWDGCISLWNKYTHS